MDVMDTDGNHSVIGKPYPYSVELLFLSHGTLLVGSLLFVLDGCDMPEMDADMRFFESLAQAQKAGCDVSEVSWSAYSVFNYDLEVIQHSTSMEWSGY